MKFRSQKSKQIIEKMKGDICSLLENQSYRFSEIQKSLQISEKNAPLFERAIDELFTEQRIKKNRGKIRKIAISSHVSGTLSMHPRGFGFVRTDGKSKDIFIPKPFTLDAIDGDEVEVEILGKESPKGPEGKIVTVLKRSRSHLAGIILYRKNGVYSLYCPILGPDKKVHLKKPPKKNLKSGDRVIMKVTHWGREIEGILFRYIGHISNPSLDIDAAALEFEIPSTFSKGSQYQAKNIGTKVLASDLKNRTDLTELDTITIDPDTAKDFDDALSLTRDEKNNFELGVHIADVAFYVKSGSTLDKEAFLRGNSTYFPGKCIPMLPETLSNGLCSLKPEVLRLTVTVFMRFSSCGELLDHKIERSYIKSKKRFTYKEALLILENKKKSPFASLLKEMAELGTLLRKKRLERGSIDFALPEAKLVVDSKGAPQKIEVIEYDITHQLVEEFMLKANELVALNLTNRGKQLIYRIHEEPKDESFEDFFQLARILGFSLPAQPKHTDIQKLFEEAKNSSHLHRLSIGFIRSMKLAFYSPDNLGHYGLQLEHYAHFTSPIRRYSDLIIQRLLFDEETKEEDLTQIASSISDKERVSMKAENSVNLLKKLRLLIKSFHSDPYETYKATVTRVKPFAIFFELTEFFLEGSVHVSEIGDDYYLFNPSQNRLIGEHTKQSFAFGDEVEVMVVDIDLIMQDAKYQIVPSKRS